MCIYAKNVTKATVESNRSYKYWWLDKNQHSSGTCQACSFCQKEPHPLSLTKGQITIGHASQHTRAHTGSGLPQYLNYLLHISESMLAFRLISALLSSPPPQTPFSTAAPLSSAAHSYNPTISAVLSLLLDLLSSIRPEISLSSLYSSTNYCFVWLLLLSFFISSLIDVLDILISLLTLALPDVSSCSLSQFYNKNININHILKQSYCQFIQSQYNGGDTTSCIHLVQLRMDYFLISHRDPMKIIVIDIGYPLQPDGKVPLLKISLNLCLQMSTNLTGVDQKLHAY